MRAVTIVAPGRVRLDEVPIPEPGPGEVRIRLEGSGVCASNLSVWGGQPWFEYPLPPGAPGHEGWGFVDAVGQGVENLREGDRVTGLSGHAYAEYDVARASDLVPLPSHLDGRPFPGEPLGCAFNILRRSEIEPGQTVAILGVGFLGAVLTRLASQAGARVIAISRRPWALAVAAESGANEVLEMRDRGAVIARVTEMTDGRLCERVIECTGKQWPLDLGGEITRERGRLVIAGYHQDGPRQVNLQLWNWRGIDVINAHERDPAEYLRGIREAIEAVRLDRLRPEALLTHAYPLENLDDAFSAMLERPDGFLKAVVIP